MCVRTTLSKTSRDGRKGEEGLVDEGIFAVSMARQRGLEFWSPAFCLFVQSSSQGFSFKGLFALLSGFLFFCFDYKLDIIQH